MNKFCNRCNTEKALESFKSASGKVNNYCDVCRKEVRAAYYKNNTERSKALAKANTQRYLAKIHSWLGEYLSSHPCVDCGNQDILVLEFDHVNDDKEDSVGRIIRRTLNLDKVKAEVAKCEVRCVNCHRRITNKRRLEAKSNA